MLDKSKLKMEGMKEEFDKVKAHNEELINERSLLAKRAAVGFGELTPRPNIRNIFGQKNLRYEDFVHLSEKNRTTENAVIEIIEKLKYVNEEKMRKKQVKKKETIVVEKNEFS